MITLELYREGKEIKEMAKIREMTSQTIENHLLKCAEEQLLDLEPLIPREFVEKLQDVAKKHKANGLKAMKEQLPAEISYFMIRAFLVKYS